MDDLRFHIATVAIASGVTSAAFSFAKGETLSQFVVRVVFVGCFVGIGYAIARKWRWL